MWLFLIVGLGFIIGFWGVCGTLIIKKSWRIAYYRFADRIMDKLVVFVSVNTARFRRGAEEDDRNGQADRMVIPKENTQTISF